MLNSNGLGILETLELIKTANKSTNIGVFEFEVESNKVYWDNQFKSIFEFEEDFGSKKENFLKFIRNSKKYEQILKQYSGALQDKKPFNLEHEITTDKGNQKSIRLFGQPVFKEGIFHSFKGAAIDITKREKREKTLLNKNKYSHFVEGEDKIGYWRWNFLKKEGTWSDNVYRIFEWDKDSEISFDIYVKHIHPDDVELFNENIEDAILNQKLTPFAHRFILKNGTIKTLFIKGQALTNKEGDVVEIVGTCQDISEEKAKEEELIYQKKRQNITERVSKTGSWQWNIEEDEFKTSENLREVFGFGSDIKINIALVRSCIHPDDLSFSKSIFQEIKETREPRKFSHRIVLSDGSQKILEVFAQAEVNNKGEVTHLIGSTQDITDYTVTKEILKKKNQQLNYAEQIVKVGFWSWKPGNDLIFCSDNLYHIFGKPNDEEFKSDTYLNCVHPEDKDYVVKTIETSINNLQFQNFSHRIICHNGTLKTIQIVGELTCGLEGKRIEINGTCIDISESESKTAEIKLRNQQLRIAEKMAMIGSWQWNFKTNEIKWSDNLYTIYGHEKTIPISLDTYINYIHDDDKKYLNTLFEETIRSKEFKNSTHKIQLKDGSVKVLNSIGKVITNKRGDILEIIGVCQDITKSRKDELELLQKNQSLSFAEEITGMGNWKWEVKTNKYEWSENLYKIVGIEIGSKISKEKYLTKIPVEEREMWLNYVETSLKNKSFKKFTHHIIKPDDSVITLEVNAKIIIDDKGEITEVFGTSQDITEREKEELQLIEKNQFLSLAQELAMIGYWRLDLTTLKVEWSDNLYKMYDLEVGTPLDLEKTLTRVHPDDRVFIENLHDKHSKTNKFEKFTHRAKHEDGTIRTIEVAGQVIKDKSNKAIEFIGTSQDITERIEKELELTEKNQQLNLAEEMAMVGCWVLDINTQEFVWSDNTYRIFDFDIGTPVDLPTLLERVPKEEHKAIKILINGFLETKIFEKFTHGVVHRDGSLRTVEVAGKVITDKANNAIEFIGSTRDITEDLKVQQEILNANKNLEESTVKLSARNRQLAEFNQISSHNLRAPVGNLKTLLGLYKVAQKEDKAEIFEKFETVIDHLALTLDTLVESLKIKNSPDQILEELSFDEVLNKTKEILSAEILKTGAIIKCNFTKKEKLQYNPIYLESIFLNLVGNAIKYSSPDRIPEINITSNYVNEKTTLKIEDNGLGIDLEKHGHKLFGLNKVFHRHPDAQGVGLFLTKAQIETMGGTIYAESEVNVGTTFHITLN